MKKIAEIVDTIKNRKYLAISIALHVVLILAVIIFLQIYKFSPKKPIKINEVELFNPDQQEQKSEESKDQKSAEISKPQEEMSIQKKTRRPPPEPLKSNLKDEIEKKWENIEKKNLLESQ